jgi:hypothetical protein
VEALEILCVLIPAGFAQEICSELFNGHGVATPESKIVNKYCISGRNLEGFGGKWKGK